MIVVYATKKAKENALKQKPKRKIACTSCNTIQNKKVKNQTKTNGGKQNEKDRE